MSLTFRPYVCSFTLSALVLCQPAFSQEELQVGYAVVNGDVDEQEAPFGTALFTFKDSGGVLVSQAGVGAVRPIAAGRVFVDQVGTRTAVALVNTDSDASVLDLVLKDETGHTVDGTSHTFQAGEHLPLFVDELFDLPDGFMGSLSFSSADGQERWAAVTLRQSPGPAGRFIIATLPVVADSSTGGSDSILFPQVGAGPGLSTQVLLINPTGSPLHGHIQLTDSTGAPLVLELQGMLDSRFEYSIPAFGVIRMEFSRSDNQTAVGYAVVTPDEGTTPAGTALFQFTNGSSVISEAGVGAAPLLTRVRLFVDNAGTRTGVALASPGNPSTPFTFRLLDREQRFIEDRTREVEENGHLAIFADELFTDVPGGFTGILEITAAVPFAPVTLKLTMNARGEPILTTLPVVDLDHPRKQTPVYFPQVGFGLGFSTRLILLSGDLTTSTGGRLSFFDSSGLELPVPIEGETASSTAFTLGAGAARQFYPGITAEAAEILVQTVDLTINQGSTRPLRPIVLDELGNARDDLPLSFQSLNPETIEVDQAGNMTALNRGFSTIVISSGDLLRRFTVTSGTITAGLAGFAPTDVAQDFAGNIFLANGGGHTILETDGLEQTASLYAGTPDQPGFQNGPRLQARFKGPTSLTIDQGVGGEVYVSDTLNHLIRVVRPGSGGQVSTLAGRAEPGSEDGPALQATFRAPEGVALDDRGYLWIADTGNQTIRRINLATGEVSTVAGRAGSPGNTDGVGDQARFNQPKDLVYEAETLAELAVRDQTGAPPPPASVLVADSGNGLIRRVWEDGSVETLTTLNLQASRAKQPPVRLQAAPAVRFDFPSGLVRDPFGNLFVSETETGLVKVLLRTGEVVLAAEPGSFDGPGGMTTTIRGRILVAESRRTVQQIRYAGPSIFSVEPVTVSANPGQAVTIFGRNFAPESVVIIGDVVVDSINFKDTTEISFISPALPSGRQTLTVQHRGGQAQTQIDIVPPAASALAPGGITTLAGGTSAVGDGLQATQAALLSPAGIAVSRSGDLFVSDAVQHRVRRVSAISGVIQTVIGSGSVGPRSSVGNGPPVPLDTPARLVVDASGTLLVADRERNQILAYDPESGQVEVIAGTGRAGFSGDGGDALDAELNAPSGLALDSDGNLWISDTGNHRVRRLDHANDIIETVAGTGNPGFSGDDGNALEADLNSPLGLTARVDGSLLIADSGNHRIRLLRPDATIVSIAGSGTAGFYGDGGSALHADLDDPEDVALDADGTIYIADAGNQRIRQVVDGTISTLAGTGLASFGGDGGPATAASFNHPSALVADGSGYLLVADTGNRRIRRIHLADGSISTVAGSDADFSGDGGPAWKAALADPAGLILDGNRILLAERGGHRIRAVEEGTTPLDSPPGIANTLAGTGFPGDSEGGSDPLQAKFHSPTGLAVEPEGGILFSDTGNQRLRRLEGGLLSNFAGTGSPGFQDDVPALEAPLNAPTGLAVDASGDVIWADTLNHRIRHIGAAGYVSVIAGTGVAGFSGDGGRPYPAQLNAPQGVFISQDGRLFVADTGNHRIRLITRNPDRIVTIAGNGVQGYSGDGGPALEASLDSPTGLFVDDLDRLFVADTGNHRIRMIDLTTGTIETIAGLGEAGFSGDGGPATAARLHSPWGLTVDSQGNLFVADSGNQRIRFIRAAVPPTQ